ncbi:MAG: BtrH N-terminal domain-containing protein [Candidatus Thorarchaeota archaeon]|nr:MAG: BtrH N-terminal domain-containing protein [Candidatus Thorarchaeota archaeon]
MTKSKKQREFQPAGIGDEKLVLDFDHFGDGKNCQTSAMVRLMHHLGHDISEPMLVGISSGLGFIYWFMKMMSYPVVGGMNRSDCRKFPGILGKAARRLGGDFESILTRSVKKAHVFLKDTLRNRQPCLVCVDMAYLDHLLTGEDDHFGEHNFRVYGIDETKNEAYISDRFHGTHIMPLTQLQKARASEYPPFPAMNQAVRFTFPEKLTPVEEVIPSAIRENIDALLNPPIRNAGVKGMVKWSKELGKYPKLIPDPKELVHALVMHYVYIETGGSGGAIFRQIYTDFLREAGELLNHDGILRASEEFRGIVDTWHEISKGLLPDDYPALRQLREIQWAINSDLETKGLKALRRVEKKAERVPDLLEEAAKSEIQDFLKFIPSVQSLLIEVSEMETNTLTALGTTI